MTRSKLESPEEHLASVDKDGGRIPLYPAVESGPWRSRRTYVQIVLILVFLLLPWIKVNGEQLLLLNFISGQFAIFGITFWAHDGPYLFILLAIILLSLALFTALYGRVWCGWSCPQTVFVEGVFRRIETWIEGSHIKRRQLDKMQWNREKILKKIGKWSLFSIVSLVITHSFLAYFIGSDQLIKIVSSSPLDNLSSFIFIIIATAAILFNCSVFREQLCIFVCPYGRLQSALIDSTSTIVAYDHKRGEPHKGIAKSESEMGDCINCYKCVTVCPTGIDIRRGLQLECIHCTACIDACDVVMEKISKPKGLIRYSSEAELNKEKTKRLSTRIIAYSVLLLIAITSLASVISTRTSIHISIVRAHDVPFKNIPNDNARVLNHLSLNIKNQELSAREIIVSLPTKYLVDGYELIFPMNPIRLKAGEKGKFHFFLKVPKQFLANAGSAIVNIELKDSGSGKLLLNESVKVLGPLNSQ